MAGYIGTKAVSLSTTGADIAGDADVSGALDVGGAFTSQGIDDNATSTAMTLDGSGNLLVGTTNTDPANSNVNGTAIGAANYFSMTRTNGASMILNRKSSDGDIALFRKDGTTVGVIGVNSSDLMIGTGDTGMRFSDGEDSFVPSTITGNANRDNAIDLGKTSSRFKDLYLSGGVFLGGTGSANKLDDYEEGTAAIYYSDGTTNSSTKTVKYTKIGDLVTITIDLYNLNVSSITGNLSVYGLPYTVNSSSGGRSTLVGSITGNTPVVCQAVNATSHANLYTGTSGGANLGSLVKGDFVSDTQAALHGQLMYRTNS